jgi:predicted transcriptional regulator
MFFWGLHANGRFDESTICYALDNDISTVGKELQNLVDAGIIEREVDNGVTSYYLTLNEGKRRSIVEWASPGHSGR